MTHSALTAKYRPQTFAEVAGQETVKAILSRASLEGKVAPAYLFSGTRGVGKTTLARIFAKALNCRTAPTAEPCNVCDQCRAVTSGSAVDVVEIDGASNRGIDDVRRLKEVVGYAAMEGGYKIFIIDEAHMLSREAFNALLKTLEEPPARVTFIMATTEAHKFPATIISRCQHYVFKRLPENGLMEHLERVLQRETVAYDDTAVRLIARRGAGSVRDSMSLLGQVLALGAGTLTEESTRNVLGLAGQDVFISIAAACKTGDGLATVTLLRTLLDQGLDMGFFLRELAAMWRNLFLLRQSGEAAVHVIELPEAEAKKLLALSREFSLQHIHASWQMTLEGQRRVLTSLEPALALELLLLNLAMMPQLLSVENISGLGRNAQNAQPSSSVSRPSAGSPGRASEGYPSPRPVSGVSQQADPAYPTVSATPRALPETMRAAVQPATPRDDGLPAPWLEEKEASRAQAALSQENTASDLTDVQQQHNDRFTEAFATVQDENPTESDGSCRVAASFLEEKTLDAGALPIATHAGDAENTCVYEQDTIDSRETFSTQKPSLPLSTSLDWDAALALCSSLELPPWFPSLLLRLTPRWMGTVLELVPQDAFTVERLHEPTTKASFEKLLVEWNGDLPDYKLTAPVAARKPRGEVQEEVLQHPLVQDIQKEFAGRIVDYGQIL